MAGMSPLSGGRQHCVILYGMWVPVAVWRLDCKLLYLYTLLFTLLYFSHITMCSHIFITSNWRLNANVICWFFVDLAEIPDGYLQVRIETNACDSLFSLFFGLLLTYVHLLEHLWGKVTVPVLQATPTVDSKVLESALCTNSEVGWIMKACSVVQAVVKPAKCPAFYICLVFSYWMVTCLTTWIML